MNITKNLLIIAGVFIFILYLGIIFTSKSFAQEPNFDVLISEYSTSYSVWGDEKGRGVNITLASKAFDDLIVYPGELISYNKLVGPRIESKGFQLAHVIVKGELVDDFGGGTCQVSGTLYSALLYAGGFNFVEHYHHTRKSSYLDVGHDATVVWPYRDLKFESYFPFPVRIIREISKDPKKKGNRILTFKVFGKEKLFNVTTKFVQTSFEKSKVIKWRSPDPSAIKREILDRGANGYKGTFFVTIENVHTKEELINEFIINYKMAEKLIVLPYKTDQ